MADDAKTQKVTLRVRVTLLDYLRARASQNNRSVNAEIVHLVNGHYQTDVLTYALVEHDTGESE